MNNLKALGQNFLIDKNKIDEIILSLGNIENLNILEVGPGKGALTKRLINSKNLVLVEIDKMLVSYLNENLEVKNNVKIFHKDFMKFDTLQYFKQEEKNKNIFVSNLPYYIASKIIFKAVHENIFDKLGFMIQKEMGDRILSKPNSKKYGRITVALKTFYEIEKKIFISKNCFNPSPKVDSYFFVLKGKDISLDKEEYLKFVKNCFRFKRKKFLNNFKDQNEVKDKIEKWLLLKGFDKNIRAEQIEIDNFIELWNYLK